MNAQCYDISLNFVVVCNKFKFKSHFLQWHIIKERFKNKLFSHFSFFIYNLINNCCDKKSYLKTQTKKRLKLSNQQKILKFFNFIDLIVKTFVSNPYIDLFIKPKLTALSSHKPFKYFTLIFGYFIARFIQLSPLFGSFICMVPSLFASPKHKCQSSNN